MNPGSTLLRAALAWALLMLAACTTTPSREALQQQSLLAAGQSLETAGDYDGALVRYVQLLQLDERNVEGHFRIGRVHAALGNAATSREAYQRALALDGQHPGALEGLGLQQLDAGERAAAAALLHKALARDNTRWRSYNGLGVLADLDSRHAVAQAYFGQALKLRPGDLTVANNLGYSYYLAGDLPKARSQFEGVLAVDPANRKGLSNLGLLLARQGKYGHAVQTLERILSPAEARYAVGYICLIDGKLDEAERLLKDSVRRSAAYDPATHAALKRVREGQERRARIGDEEE